MIDQVWMNGEWLEAGDAFLSTTDRGFLLGDTCFETLRFANGEIEGKDEHIGLLRQSMSVLEMKGGPDNHSILKALQQAEEFLRFGVVKEASVRITFSRGQGRGAKVIGAPVLVIQMSLIESGRPYAALEIKTSKIRRNETSPLTQIKAGSYGDNLAALRAAQQQGCNEALMLNTQGKVAGLAMGNIVMVVGNALITPPLSDGVRAGFTRSTFIELVKRGGGTIQERTIERQELLLDDVALFGLNSLWGARPIISIDGQAISNPPIGFNIENLLN